MRISASNTGKCITFYLDDEAMAALNRSVGAPQGISPRFGVNYRNGFIAFGPPGSGVTNRMFRRPTTRPHNRWQLSIYSNLMPNVPKFGQEIFNSFKTNIFGYSGIQLPDTLKPAKPRVMNLNNKVPVTRRIGAISGKFAGWTSEEARQRSLEGLKRGREQYQATLRANKQNVPVKGNSVQRQPQPQPQPVPKAGMANLTVQFGNKTVTYQVPEDELYEYAFELSEKGYRLK